ncbi:radical SAM protein [Streptomyces sp. CA-251387]|uniref:radical SAM protein n=1 Tax=Streptomyces sp. CA-251387 TaxID=3240064 RepID=UPI003D8E9B20
MNRPQEVNWDLTYACPLRCTHCYSESGRRPTRQLSRTDREKVADALIALGPRAVQFSGGEPLLVKDVHMLARRFRDAGIDVGLFTSGWLLARELLDDILGAFFRVHVSLDGATAAVHDRIRGRTGSFDRAVHALGLLDEAARRSEGAPVPFSIDCTLVRSNFDDMEALCRDVASRFPHLGFVSFGAAVPGGLANRESYVRHELLTDSQLDELTGPDLRARLTRLLPPAVSVQTFDGRALQMHPDLVARGYALSGLMQVEPDGRVRAMAMYEGTIGCLLDEPAETLWARARDRVGSDFVVKTLAPVRTMPEWAAAARRIDLHYGSEADRARIAARPPFDPGNQTRHTPPGNGE